MTLVDNFKKVLKIKNCSISKAAKSTNFSKTSINLWMNGKYTGNVEKLENAVREFIRIETLRMELTKVDFVETSVAAEVFDIAKVCLVEKEIGVCYGDSGVGKTQAVKKYVEEHPDVILIEADLGYSPKVLFSEIHKKLGLAGKGTVHELLEDIIDALRDSGRLIIVDEAEQLSYKSLDLLRRIYDKAQVGILLVGMPLLLQNLKGKECQYAQLYSRVGIVTSLEKLTQTDETMILESLLPNKDDIYPYITAECGGNTRVLIKLIIRAIRLAQVNRREVDEWIIKSSVKQIIR